MDNEPDKEHGGRKNSNTEYVPTKCRITKPPPPKPATNPLQFIKVAPCPLFQKAQEQIKKVEEIKKERKEIREEPEDWQANLDNWKSSRRKRQEHIIERVVEVKKLAAEEENEKIKRKSKTFSEMIEDRSKGRHKFTIPIYDDDSNDLSDYGIGGNSSKTNNNEESNINDNGTVLNENKRSVEVFNSQETFNAVQRENDSEELNHLCGSNVESYVQTSKQETGNSREKNIDKLNHTTELQSSLDVSTNSHLTLLVEEAAMQKAVNVSKENTASHIIKKEKPNPPVKPALTYKLKTELPDANDKTEDVKKPDEQYTYEGAIQDYRSRIRSKINIDEVFLTRPQNSSKHKEFLDTEVVPKGEIFKRKEVFETEKPLEMKSYESNISRRLSEDFINSQSIKQRLRSLEKCTDQSVKGTMKNEIQVVSVKERLQTFNKQDDNIINNNMNNKCQPHKISNYLIKKSHSSSSFPVKNPKSHSNWQKEEISDRSSSPETELYMNKLNIFSRDLDNLMIYGKPSSSLDNRKDNFYINSNYAPSTSSTEFLGLSSDREDSGIHTADVSCSVSQADESADIAELTAKNAIFNDTESFSYKKGYLETTEILSETRSEDFSEGSVDCEYIPKSSTPTKKSVLKKDVDLPYETGYFTKDDVIKITREFLTSLQKDASENAYMPKCNIEHRKNCSQTSKENQIVELKENVADVNQNELKSISNRDTTSSQDQFTKTKHVIYENVEIKPFIITDELMDNTPFPLAPPKLEPPKVKPPPPPPDDQEQNPTQRIKKEINVKRSSFLGLYESSGDHIESKIPTEKPPDINYFLQKESKLEKSLYKKIQEENRIGMLNKVASQDSGLDIDRGRLSSDTWCSSIGDSVTPSHDRQDSDSSFFQHTNSITSEEDEISKKEREIIELVEKEEKSRDSEFTSFRLKADSTSNGSGTYQKYDKFSSSFYTLLTTNNIEDQDSEVLKVEQELRQLEKEELERQKENMLFKESRAKAHFHNRHSLENICDEIFASCSSKCGTVNELRSLPQEYRKSMPDVLNMHKAYPETELHYGKPMSEMKHMYKNNLGHCKSAPESPVKTPSDHCRSLPELQHDIHCSAFKSPVDRSSFVPGRSLRTSQKGNDKYMNANSVDLGSQFNHLGRPKQLSRHSLHTLSAVPRPKHADSWIRPESKNYSRHWVYQEAELRRLSSQQKGLSDESRLQPQKKHIPDSIIQTLTQRVQNRANDWNPLKRTVNNLNKEYIHRQYFPHSNNMGCALSVPYNNNNSSRSSIPVMDSQERMLSVSGKKKCSYCGNELGRGAAMIIESLHLFYHMDCFKCCVCHVQLGDGLMGTDVRVRNQKLHCHNCYSSDDGVKFSCV